MLFQVSLHNYNALVDFFKKFSEFRTNEFFVTGISYAGVYVPTLSLHILQGNFKINFKVREIYRPENLVE